MPCSIPDSGMRLCSARHDKYFPWSSNVGMYVKVDLVKFPSDDVCIIFGREKKKRKENWRERLIGNKKKVGRRGKISSFDYSAISITAAI